MSNFDRICWVRFRNEEDFQQILRNEVRIAKNEYNEYRMTPAKSNLVAKGSKSMPNLAEKATERDLDLAA